MTTDHRNDRGAFRRVAATLTIGSFSIAALMGIVALLAGGSFGEGEARVLLTTLIVGCASICALCYLATAGTRWALVGAAGGVVLILPVVTSLVLVWSDWNGDDSDGILKAFGIGVVLALTLAQLCLLLALAGDGRLGAVLWPTIAIAVVLGGLITAMILEEIGADDVWRLLGVLAILDVLGTLVTIALAKFSDRGSARTRDPRLRVTLSVDQTTALERMADGDGRSPEQLVGDAVDRYLMG
jgi:F0F1-type ATP synthase assembly protein I